MSETLPYYVGFSHCLGIGPMKFKVLVDRFGDIKTAYEADSSSIIDTIGPIFGNKFLEFRKKFDNDKKIKEIQKKDIHILTREDPQFPKQILNLEDAPICLYVKGDIQSMDFEKEIFFGMVGTRVPTAYGIQVANIFADELASAGCIIVSGMAMGVDALCHTAAVRQNKKTVAFLGCGVDVIYPRVNTAWYYEIIKTGGLIISEFPPGQTTLKGLFVARNRLISGLSRGVMVVEGLKDSGSLITARCAAEQGKDVFAPPAPLTSPNSEAPNLLLKEGAKLVISAKDILEELNLKSVPKSRNEITDSLSPVEKNIYSILIAEPKLPDDIVSSLSVPVYEVLSTISGLEIKGVIEKNKEGKYQVTIL